MGLDLITINSPPHSAAYMRHYLNWVSIGSGIGLLPVRRQAITWINAHLLPIGPLGTNFSEIPIEILKSSFRKMRLIMSLAKWRSFCPGGDELMVQGNITSPHLRDLNHTKRGDKMEMYAMKLLRIPGHLTEIAVGLSGTQCSPIDPPRSLKEVLVLCTDIDLEIVVYNAFMSHM